MCKCTERIRSYLLCFQRINYIRVDNLNFVKEKEIPSAYFDWSYIKIRAGPRFRIAGSLSVCLDVSILSPVIGRCGS